ncbi:aspartate aminotransferase family protein [Mesorhizobium australicum]|uniref:Acetylornithine/N-succinyldiaminopimelate aminotransferase n=1 Tax=Mesorhizobium australicum TaxID=536018 RepID=A0A1X7MZY5_9HYPH|nr:aspartate aminotransferase family protein [Mesorhizobium australicum]SMH29615.1 acetylornithine/N-succinyldiaminopimelate aminotransferase [Mesorhizobium australicum]
MADADDSVLFNVYRRADVEVVRGEGVRIWDDGGKRYLDFMGGVAVLALGHCHPALVEALSSQARTLWHASNLLRTPGARKVARRLVDATFADAVFFNSSGSEAVDLAIKLVRRYFNTRGDGPRWRVITMERGYHGRTLATIAAGGSAKLTDGFAPLVDGFDRVPFGDLAAVEAAIGPETGAILLEPILGDGGIVAAPPEYLRGLRQLADRHGLLLILDEVQTGLGRTGRLFAHEDAGIAPDILAMGKGIGAGYPLAGVLVTRAVADCLAPGSHGGTLAGAPLGMAVADAVLDIVLDDGFLSSVSAKGDALAARLKDMVRQHPAVFAEARGVGLMRGLKCRVDPWLMAGRLRDAGLLVAPAMDDVIRLVPPLVVSDAEIEEAAAILDRVAASMASV